MKNTIQNTTANLAALARNTIGVHPLLALAAGLALPLAYGLLVLSAHLQAITGS